MPSEQESLLQAAVTIRYDFFGKGQHAAYYLLGDTPTILYCRMCKQPFVFKDESSDAINDFSAHCSDQCTGRGQRISARNKNILELEVEIDRKEVHSELFRHYIGSLFEGPRHD